MDQEIKNVLLRWRALETSEGVRRVASVTTSLRIIGLVLCVIVFVGIDYGWSPIAIAIVSAAIGWTVAETNALRNRLRQWLMLKQYIDWQRVNSAIDGQSAPQAQ